MSRLCRMRLEVPARDGRHTVVFTCNAPENHDGDHLENGRVRNRRGDVKVYAAAWHDSADTEQWRTIGASEVVETV